MSRRRLRKKEASLSKDRQELVVSKARLEELEEKLRLLREEALAKNVLTKEELRQDLRKELRDTLAHARARRSRRR